MRKLRDHILPLFFSLLCVLLLLPAEAMAAEAIDVDQDVTLTLHYEHEGKPVSGVHFDLYQVAEVNAYAEFTLTGDFKNYPVKISRLTADEWKTLAETLKSYAEQDELRALDSSGTDDEGVLSFPDTQKSLKPGLYLVVGKTLTVDGCSYRTEPFLVSLPGLDSSANTWNYNVTAEPKHTREELPPDTPEDTVTRKVLKVWKNDAEKNRPEEVTVRLLKDGRIYDTATLNKKNDWSYTWDGLPKYNEDGSKAEWSVTEKAVDGYTVLIEKNGITYKVTNTGTGTHSGTQTSGDSEGQPSAPTKLPQTGMLWWPVPLLAAGGLCFLILGAADRKKRRYDET